MDGVERDEPVIDEPELLACQIIQHDRPTSHGQEHADVYRRRPHLQRS